MTFISQIDPTPVDNYLRDHTLPNPQPSDPIFLFVTKLITRVLNFPPKINHLAFFDPAPEQSFMCTHKRLFPQQRANRYM